MFKITRGFDLFDRTVESKIIKTLSDRYNLKTLITAAISIAGFLLVWYAQPHMLGLGDISVIEQRTAAIFVFAVLMWVLEVVPAWCTSVVIITLLLLTVSDSRIGLFDGGDTIRQVGTAMSYKVLLATFADPIIMLFLGGFILAIAATKTGLDVVLARVLLKPFGTKSENVLLGFLLVTGLFSMFISNTATVAMMLALLAPVLKALPGDGKGRIALTLAIPLAANIGGIGTPIGTPPNAIALKYLNDPEGLNLNIGFGEWMSCMFPFAMTLLVISWIVLRGLFPFKQKHIHLNIEGNVKKGLHTVIVYITFAVTVSMWMLDKLTGVNANVVAMIPIAVFCLSGVFNRKDLEKINWSVLWMVAGGFAIGAALNDTGLAAHFVEALNFSTWPPVLVILGGGFVCWGLSNFISNTATASLLVPILAVIGTSMLNILTPYGGVQTLLMGIAISASLAMILPISTPPNAMAHSTGLVTQNEMAKAGLIMGVTGLVIGYIMLVILGSNGLL
jgi:sodium-dependent dicarboxylate transporter 2/3/5